MLELDNSVFTELTTERLVLRALSPDDVEAVFELRSDPVAMHYVPRPLATSLDDAAAHIALILDTQRANNCVQWAIALKGDPTTMVGIVGFWRMKKEHYRAELGYMLSPRFWGAGLITEAIAAVADHAFNVLGLHSIEAIVDADNPASMRVLEKNDFVREAWFREDFFWNGKFRDSVVYGKLNPK
ncbi:MAG TPA: GNAT family protein [Flavobacteriales bacterium]|nr:GNAT family protein [Flavobacteriales bacterium]